MSGPAGRSFDLPRWLMGHKRFGPEVGLGPWTQPRQVALKGRGEATMVHPPSRAGGIKMVGWSPVLGRYSR